MADLILVLFVIYVIGVMGMVSYFMSFETVIATMSFMEIFVRIFLWPIIFAKSFCRHAWRILTKE